MTKSPSSDLQSDKRSEDEDELDEDDDKVTLVSSHDASNSFTVEVTRSDPFRRWHR